MAGESCNLGKDEAEILKPSSPPPPSSSSSSQPAPQQPQPCLLLKSSHDFSALSSDGPETEAVPVVDVSAVKKVELEPRQSALSGNRCLSCRKRVGLTGFRCRCGDLFCSRHRYSDTHDCSYDYKAAGREEISKANPVIRAAKIIKI
ncbi:hypothetical protein HPP92_004124 [Vanilla planifolia]|uniref:AN1-type domain-containing protein n=1 Tax=Vanilla planifolia TaxID=51239 RepID=A0A835VM45_VANPL|nr:hypothetical protein HPP92_004124 [Vanilla planifolia]